MDEKKDNNVIDDQVLDDTIEAIENYLFGKGDNCGEALFINFARANKQYFENAGLGKSTENNFKFSELFQQFQVIYEEKLEQIINTKGINSEQFYNGLSKRCEEDDQEVILFVDIINEIINYNSFIEMMANLVNKV